jgi:hypothetical protein
VEPEITSGSPLTKASTSEHQEAESLPDVYVSRLPFSTAQTLSIDFSTTLVAAPEETKIVHGKLDGPVTLEELLTLPRRPKKELFNKNIYVDIIGRRIDVGSGSGNLVISSDGLSTFVRTCTTRTSIRSTLKQSRQAQQIQASQ